MRVEFTRTVLRVLLAEERVTQKDRVVALCAGESDEALFRSLEMWNVTYTNVDVASGTRPHGTTSARREGRYEQADAHALPFDDGSFDVSFVADGLHHCRSPHRAVTEMYRVARRAVVVVESRDSILMRFASRFGLTAPFEINGRLLETRRHGGVDFGAVPNFVYRWTERDFEKLLTTYDPAHKIAFAYFYGLSVPANALLSTVGSAITAIAPRQGNTFAMVAMKAGQLWSYLGDDMTLRDEVRTPSDARSVMRSLPHPERHRHKVRPSRGIE